MSTDREWFWGKIGGAQHVAFWDAVNEYADSCRMNPGNTSLERQKAVVKVECIVEGAATKLAERVKVLEGQRQLLVSFAKNVSSNFDCDSDAHKYGTFCRAYEAESVLAQCTEGQAGGEGQ